MFQLPPWIATSCGSHPDSWQQVTRGEDPSLARCLEVAVATAFQGRLWFHGLLPAAWGSHHDRHSENQCHAANVISARLTQQEVSTSMPLGCGGSLRCKFQALAAHLAAVTCQKRPSHCSNECNLGPAAFR